ncbi:YdeI/OmpD-associated family protein [Pseudoflavitalea rhizosphaerae]|uniref:YdeI/OmpD-associated family protein n=1 Tax=Pseudoflavitalea rhizosphaerae TaxID=1884793 RepID=UPI000F8DB6B5|nr:YdeI/OmpD-associated family protein [Pseudoflavitalea rhizosphaerae]
MTKEINIIDPGSRAQWRIWLEKNHEKTGITIWVKIAKKNTEKRGLPYDAAVEEALCFGWIDSTTRSFDESHFIQSFTIRKPKSPWSPINKERVKRLIKDGLMTPAGNNCIKTAKANGYWTIMDEVEHLKVPADLQAAFRKNRKAEKFFEAMSKSDKKLTLKWLVLAQKQETRNKRIITIIENGNEGQKPKQLQ